MKIYRNLTKLVLLGCSVMLVFPYTANAHDLDRVVYPGHICQFAGVPIPGATRTTWRRFGGGLFNMDDRFRVYICPILRTHSPTEAIEEIVVMVEDAHPDEDPRCRLLASGGDGSPTRVTPYRTGVGSGRVKEVAIRLTDFPPRVRTLPLLQMECVIPEFTGEVNGYSGLLSYSVEPCGRLGCSYPAPFPQDGPIDLFK